MLLDGLHGVMIHFRILSRQFLPEFEPIQFKIETVKRFAVARIVDGQIQSSRKLFSRNYQPAIILSLENLKVRYGNIEVVHGIDLHAGEGEIVTILGANGAGKSTTLLSISGLVKPSDGIVRFGQTPIQNMPAHSIVRKGIAQVPEGRRIFGTLTVRENLRLGAYVSNDPESVKKSEDWIYTLFPVLAEDPGNWEAPSAVASSKCWPSHARS